ncbi:MAG TPA: filamentous hemagglutinin family protein [Rhizomicrobium sp.]
MFNLSASASHKSLLLGGASFAAMLLMAPVAHATTFTGMTGKNVSQVPNTVATKPVSGPAITTPGQAAAQSQTTTDFSAALARIQSQLSAQAAQHNAQVNIPFNVPDGLAVGGLNPVANPVRAAQDTTGLITWEGASAPSQTTDAAGNANVTVHQSQQNAILSWQTFNIGKKTTLNFDQQGNKDWVALNRVVGSTAPSQILGNIKADGTVLVINQNGILFGGSSQVNVHSLIASTLEIGPAQPTGNEAVSIAQRDQAFLSDGLFGQAVVFDPAPDQVLVEQITPDFSLTTYAIKPSSIVVQNGAQIASGDGGYILMTSQVVDNAGHLSADNGEVILAGGDELKVAANSGAADSIAPGIRGLLVSPITLTTPSTLVTVAHSVANEASGLIESPRGSIFLSSTDTVVNAGILSSTTSVSRNGAVEVSAPNIEIAPGSTISITPDNDGSTIPQDPASLADFKSSIINISNLNGRAVGSNFDTSALVDIGSNALVFAPSGNITVGGSNQGGQSINPSSRIFIDSGAAIDAAGLEDVQIPASRDVLTIGPIKGNELAESPLLRNSFLNGATVTLDPRLSGVRDDGVAWIGSPLIDAASYYQQVGVSVSELMTKGGNVNLGVNSYQIGSDLASAPNIVVKSGAVINIAGGWTDYQAGKITTTRLIDNSGHIVDIGDADPNDTYIGVYGGFRVNHPRWAVTDAYTSSLLLGSHFVPAFTQGADAGSLSVLASATALDGTVYGETFPGIFQIADAKPGTGTSSISGDERLVQAAPSELPAGGFLFVDALNTTTAGAPAGGGADILVQAAQDHVALPSSLSYGQSLTIATDGSGTVIVPATRDPASIFTLDQLETIALSDGLLSGSGFSQVSLHTSGAITVAANAAVTLDPGGIFDAVAGHTLTINGAITAPSGTINLTTFDSRGVANNGSVFLTPASTIADDGSILPMPAPALGSFDIVVNGKLSTRGLWVNDFGLNNEEQKGGAWLDGGSIALYAAPDVSSFNGDYTTVTASTTATDLSGSILVNAGALLDVSSGGRIDQKGKFDLTAKGGNLSLYDETAYFQIADLSVSTSSGIPTEGSLDGLRVNGLSISWFQPYIPVNPDQMNARVAIDPNAIRAQGFGGGGTFTLTTPEFAFSDDSVSTASANATKLPLSFFSTAGFANYDITSYKTALFANPFVADAPADNVGGTDALLATQVLTIGAGQNLNLTQAMLPGFTLMNAAQRQALLGLSTGGDISSVLTPEVPTDAWYRQAANLNLGGLLELDVAQGGSITGDAGAVLTTSGLLNQGTIRIAGGTITQAADLPSLYTLPGTEAIHALSDIFNVNPDGTISETAASKIDDLTNAELAGATSASNTVNPIYLLGQLDAGVGVDLAPGSVTDLSGASIRNPDAQDSFGNPITTGRIVGGGTLQAVSNAALTGRTLFRTALNPLYSSLAGASIASASIGGHGLDVDQNGRAVILDPGSVLNISGASDTYDEPDAIHSLGSASSTVPTAVWSDAGTLSAGAGVTLTGAVINAHGGSAQAENGTLVMLDPILAQHDPLAATANVVSSDFISEAGFDTLVALGSIYNQGNATITLGRGFFLETRPFVNDGKGLLLTSSGPGAANLAPTIRSTGGILTINAPYVDFNSTFDTIGTSAVGSVGTGNVIFNAQNIDFTGAVLVDQSVANATFNASGDIRLTGVVPWQQTYFPGSNSTASLNGMIAGNGDLTFNAGQVYPTTGSSFSILSAGTDSTISFGRSGSTIPVAPYSAGGSLLVQAANIVQGGVIRVPLGTLTLGGNTASIFAPATESLILTDGSLTSVSANGLDIPYGTTTDQTEWYFAPTNVSPLTAPPSKVLNLNGGTVAAAAGATTDLSGGGDIYAYEFVPGTGGSRDVLDQHNPDAFTSSNGYQYADKRQVYAIVPGLSSNPLPVYDPIYSANYAALSSTSQVGKRVHLAGGNGLAAGWYTLLPAQYALLPGGMRVVEDTGATAPVGLSRTLQDGTLVTTGYYGDALSGASQSQLRLFDVQSQAVIANESKIALTTGADYFAALAAHAGVLTPRLAGDAGRLVINPVTSLDIDSAADFITAFASGARGAQVDVGGTNIDILASLDGAPADGALHVTATGLSALNADSLLVGGTRTDKTDGTTTLNVTANNILLSNDGSTALSAGEILLAANSLDLADGSSILAKGTVSDTRTGDYQIGTGTVSGAGVLLRVANGPERLITRTNSNTTGSLNVGAATLSGDAVLLDSSGANTLSTGLAIQNAKFVALDAPRIGFNADPATYTGLVISDALKNLLTQSGAQLTLRSGSSIDFADGTYTFGVLRLDANSLSGLDGGAVTIDADVVGLSNVGAAGTICTACTPGDGKLAINAGRILFTGGDVALQTVTLATDAPVTLPQDMTVTLPIGTHIFVFGFLDYTLTAPTQMVIPAGTPLTLANGTGLMGSQGGALAAGAMITPASAPITLASGGTYTFPNGVGFFQAGSYPLLTSATVTLPASAQVILDAATATSSNSFFGGGVALTAQNGIFSEGAKSALEVGSAALTLHTPYLGDLATPLVAGSSAAIPSLAFNTTGAIVIDNNSVGVAPTVIGVPGAALTLNGQSVSVTGTDVRATGGTLTINAANGIAVNAGATVEAPGYSKSFGDATDPYAVDAPGGLITLNAQNGDIALASGSTISLGGDIGNGGAISLNASNGTVATGGVIQGAPGGASLTINSHGAFDLTAFAVNSASNFAGDITIESGAGNLALAAGNTIKASNVSLTADGGAVDIAGGIGVSGIYGGNVDLFGTGGVTLEGTAQIAARATGYGPTDTRQATAGTVELGTAGSGAITIASGAMIDVSAVNTQARIVEGQENGLITYNYVAADQGGTVILRAPAIGADGAESVNISVGNAGSIKGADSIIVEGYRAYDLGAIAAGGQYSGVTVSGNTATLDLAATGLPNFLADEAAGTLPTFVQNFNIGSSYSALGGLASQANFHARPGMELDFNGDITLASNWNLAAGVVDVAGATAAGLMTSNTATGEAAILPGDEAAVLAQFTHMLYRVGGTAFGEPGVLSIRAKGQLNIDGSITDGFFTFRDQTDPAYLSNVFGFGNKTYDTIFNITCNGDCTQIPAYDPNYGFEAYVDDNEGIFSANYQLLGAGISTPNLIPYNAAANAPDALGAGPGGQGDPIGTAEIFPLIQGPNGLQAVQSWTYNLVGGAKAGSANPLQVQAGATGGVTVQGTHSYSYGTGTGASTLSDTVLFNVNGTVVTLDQLQQAIETAYGMNGGSEYVLEAGDSVPSNLASTVQADMATFFSSQSPDSYSFLDPGVVATTLDLGIGFLTQEFSATGQWPALKAIPGDQFSTYMAPQPSVTPVTVTVQTLIRSGTGAINLAAAGTIDLRNGVLPTTIDGGTVLGTIQRGGVPIYTAGVPVTPGQVTAIDSTTGLAVTLDPSAFATNGNYVGSLQYGYGALTSPTNTFPTGVPGILVSNTMYATDGGDITISAGGDVLGRRDTFDESTLSNIGGGNSAVAPFLGYGNQSWRTGQVGAPDPNNPLSGYTNIVTDPQMFLEGLGTLGGGDVTVKAGGAVSDLTVAASTSVTTGTATGGVSAGQIDRGLITFGGGNVTIAAAGNLLGSRIDIGSGTGEISVGGNIGTAGSVNEYYLIGGVPRPQPLDNTLRLMLTDATIDVTSHGDAVLDGIRAFAPTDYNSSGQTTTDNLKNDYAANFYSPNAGVSLIADGSVTLQQNGDVLPLGSGDLAQQNLAVLPGSLTVIGLTGDLTLTNVTSNFNGTSPSVYGLVLNPSPTGELILAAGNDVSGTTVAMLDSQPGAGDAIPGVLPTMSDLQRRALHDPSIPHQNDAVPNRIYAGNDIDNLIVYSPKQTRIGASQDIVNMMFFGQNLNATDITRIVAGRDITATSLLIPPVLNETNFGITTGTPEAALQGNTFVIGGPGNFMLEAGRDIGPFLNSADVTYFTGNGANVPFASTTASFAGGILAVGNEWNPWLSATGAAVTVNFGVANGMNYDGLREQYLDPANLAAMPDYLFTQQQEQITTGTLTSTITVADRSKPIYGAMLVSWMQANYPGGLVAAFGTTSVSYTQAYQVFASLPALTQRVFLNQIYFNELKETADPDGPSYLKYARGYQAVNTLFPASDGYTQNDLTGGDNGANQTVETGNLDLRLATIQSGYGGSVDIMGPGGRVLGGSTVRTSAQAARRTYDGGRLYVGNGGIPPSRPAPAAITAIPAGYEGVLTLRGGDINTFTDGDFLLNQSRLFTEQGGQIMMWSSNADLNAGQGPKTSANFPPVVVKVSSDLFVQPDQAGATTGAGIAALQATPDSPPSDVFLIAPRGTVDAGDAGIRVSGNLSIAALAVANADNVQVKGQSFGLPPQPVTNLTLTTASTAATEAASIASNMRAAQPATMVDVEVTGFGGDDPNNPDHCVVRPGNSCAPSDR